MKITKNIILLILGLIIISFPGCRKQWDATQADMTEYAWDMFESGDYATSNEWFLNATELDPSYKDAFNGLGWSYGKLREMETELDSSIKYFERGLLMAEDVNILVSLEHEILAGLCFAYNANGEDSLAIIHGNLLLDAISEEWEFSHNPSLNYHDILITVASSNYFIGDFSTSLLHVQTVRQLLDPNALLFSPDIETVIGRQILAEELETLRGIVSQ